RLRPGREATGAADGDAPAQSCCSARTHERLRRAGHRHLPYSHLCHQQPLSGSLTMKRALLFTLLLASPAALLLLNKTLRAQSADQAPAAASITFDRIWNDFTPQKITLAVWAGGQGKYASHTAAKPPD